MRWFGMRNFKILMLIVWLKILNINAMNHEEVIDLNSKLWMKIYKICLSNDNRCYNPVNCRCKIEELLIKGANPDGRSTLDSFHGNTPLIYAISIFDIDLIRILLNAKADVDMIDPILQIYPIHKILDFLENDSNQDPDLKVKSYKILDLLITHGADLEITNLQGRTASDRCALVM